MMKKLTHVKKVLLILLLPLALTTTNAFAFGDVLKLCQYGIGNHGGNPTPYHYLLMACFGSSIVTLEKIPNPNHPDYPNL